MRFFNYFLICGLLLIVSCGPTSQLKKNMNGELGNIVILPAPLPTENKSFQIPGLAIYIPVFLFFLNVLIKRNDEKRAIRLKRLEQQISDLYGPLFTWYEIGLVNYQSYIKAGHYTSFVDHNYRLWLNEVFMKTNSKIEELIIEHSELFVGAFPKECIDFCQHITVLKTCIAEIKQNKKTKKKS